MSRLVVVSNRVNLPPGNEAPGGLAVSLAATLRATGGLWFGWSGSVAAHSPALHRQTLDKIDYATVDLSPAEYRDYYHGFCNGILWPLCHGLPALAGASMASYRSYQAVNQRYAALLEPLLEDSDLVWVHDYHLLPLGAHLRAAGCRQRIGFFLHVPCPALPALEPARELLTALLAYDLIGFQTAEDLLAFHAAARGCWGPTAIAVDGSLVAAGRRVALGLFPVGIDVAAVSAAAERLTTAQAALWWPRDRATPRVIGVDRLDISKGLPLRLEAYRAFLAARPSPATIPDYLQLVTPSRSDLPAHRKLCEGLRTAAREINRQHAAATSPALRCMFTPVPHATLMGLLSQADVGLITPLKDGMNLLAKEFIAAQPRANPGALVLSAFAGAARELEAALIVDPHDTTAVAKALATALAMPLGERRERHAALLSALQRNELTAWSAKFLRELQAGERQAGVRH